MGKPSDSTSCACSADRGPAARTAVLLLLAPPLVPRLPLLLLLLAAGAGGRDEMPGAALYSPFSVSTLP